MKTRFRLKLTLSFLFIFILFTAGIVVFEQQRAKRYKTEALLERLDAYADEIYRQLQLYEDLTQIDSLLLLMPDKLRLTLIRRDGSVLSDNAFALPATLENHANRPEVRSAIEKGSGSFIRTSASNSQPYLYYAKDNGSPSLVRVALPYDIQVRSFLKPDNAFLYFVIALFFVGLGLIYYVGHHFGASVKNLRDFSLTLHPGQGDIKVPTFPKDELGEVGAQLVQSLNQLKKSQKDLAQEREKLLLHIQTSAEGVCFFHPNKSIALYNGLFMQHFSSLYNEIPVLGSRIFAEGYFPEVAEFLRTPSDENYYETQITKYGKEFLLRLNIFEDGSFEIILTDVTAKEKTRRLKQEMTGNIAHELRTPVTSIRGFLETLLHNQLEGDKAREYLERAYSQTKTLSELISDMSLLTRIDEKREVFDSAPVVIQDIIDKLRLDMAAALEQKQIAFIADIPQDLKVRGNKGLLYSVFRNLTDNVLRHAGEHIEIRLQVLGTKDGRVSFSFADTGKGIADEEHLHRLFERFYRVNEGRTRDTGGSGLGLAIVKNAIQLHGGQISVRNRPQGGLEFLFSLAL